MPIIDQLSIPSAAALNFADGDVRHLGPGDELGVPAVSGATRHLAHRDNLVASRLNEVIAEVNNKEQLIPVPIVRIILPPSVVETVTNFRIPSGYEARILNATVYSTSGNVRLDVLWSSSFGDVSGTSVVSTLSEASAGTTFFGTGEFIVQLNNTGSLTEEVAGSVMLTMRPVGTAAGGLIGPGAVGPEGPAGPQGVTGATGSQGPVGPAGSPGMTWRGLWSNGSNYARNDVVRYNSSGSGYSSYIAIVGNTNSVPPDPDAAPDGVWDLVAEAGDIPASSSNANLRYRGDWTSTPSPLYTENDLVSYSSGSVSEGWIAGPTPTVTLPPTTGNGWIRLVSSTTTEVEQAAVFGVIQTGADYVPGTFGAYSSTGTALGTYPLQFEETRYRFGSQNAVLLRYAARHYFSGTASVTFPQQVNLASVDWTDLNSGLTVTPNGSSSTYVVKDNGSRFRVVNPTIQRIQLNAFGVDLY